MHASHITILSVLTILAFVLIPAGSAVDPLWTADAADSRELSSIVISGDGSTIIAGGDQLIALTRDGRQIWTGWSGTSLVISRDGNYLLTARDQTVRMISGRGTMLWDDTLSVPVTELDMLPDASLIAAGGATRIRLINITGTGFRQNVSLYFNHFRFFPDGKEIVITTKDGIQLSNLTLFSEWTDTNVTQDAVLVDDRGDSFVTVTNNRVRLYTRSGTLLWDRALPGGNALAQAFSGNGETVVVGRDDTTVQALDREGTVLWTDRLPSWVTSVAVSGNGNVIAAGCLDGTIAVYDRAGTKLGTSRAKNPVRAHSVAVSSDGSLIVMVDTSRVYGFSLSQFVQPVTAVATPSSSQKTPAAPATAATTASSPPAETMTPRAALPMVLPLAAAGILLLRQHRRS